MNGYESDSITAEIAAIPVEEQVRNFLRVTASAGDIVEVRFIPRGGGSVEQRWIPSQSISRLMPYMLQKNAAGYGVYVGINPRKSIGLSGDDNIPCARCLCVDCDPSTGYVGIPACLERVADAGLPEPTAVVFSGHGCWVYWRLAEPIHEMVRWRGIQKGLIAALKTDGSIHNPERVARLPGFMNWKEPQATAFLWSVNPELVYPLADFSRVIIAHNEAEKAKPSRPIATPEQLVAQGSLSKLLRRGRHYLAEFDSVGTGRRNITIFKAAGSLASLREKNGESLPEAEILKLVIEFNLRCDPPLPEKEIGVAVHSALTHGTPRALKYPRENPREFKNNLAMRCALEAAI